MIALSTKGGGGGGAMLLCGKSVLAVGMSAALPPVLGGGGRGDGFWRGAGRGNILWRGGGSMQRQGLRGECEELRFEEGEQRLAVEGLGDFEVIEKLIEGTSRSVSGDERVVDSILDDSRAVLPAPCRAVGL